MKKFILYLKNIFWKYFIARRKNFPERWQIKYLPTSEIFSLEKNIYDVRIKIYSDMYIKILLSRGVNIYQLENYFCFRGEEYKEGDKVRVSKHYAGYKQQYNFIVGELFLGINNIPMVRIEINSSDIEQSNEIHLECWENVAKI